ncbi:MAG: glycoside hydrolase family 3 C-terminal domain-containing protein, partial [Lysobacterales bacterium]
WLPGSEGHGVSDVLFGDFDFQGTLSFAWPGDDRAPSHGNSPATPLFHPGYGLRYAQYSEKELVNV